MSPCLHRSARSIGRVRGSALLRAAGLAAALVLSGPGCGRDDEVERTLQQAADQLGALTPSGSPSASETVKQSTLTQVRTQLQQAVTRGTPSQKAAAQVLISQAELGLAIGPAEEAIARETEALQRGVVIRAALDQYIAASARARAASSFDPAPELAAIAEQDRDRAAAIEAAQGRKAEIERRIADLRAQAKGYSDQGRSRLAQANELRARALNESAVAAEATLRQARDIAREGDRLEAQGATLDAEAAKVAPELPAAELELARLADQRALLERARRDVDRRAQAQKTVAAEARAEAAAAAQDITRLAGELHELRTGPLAAATEQALAGYGKAASAAQQAVSDNRASASLARGVALQSVGDVRWTQAHGLKAYAETLEALAGVQPPLGDGAGFKARAAEARTAHEESLKAATESYQSARAAYASAGGGAEAKARLESLGSRLAEAMFLTSGGQVDERPKPETPEGAPPEEGQPADGAAPADGAPAAEPPAEEEPIAGNPPADLVAAINASYALAREKRYDEVMANVIADDATKQILRTQFGTNDKFLALDTAMRARFQKGLIEAMGPAAAQFGISEKTIRQELSARDFRFEVVSETEVRAFPAGSPMGVDYRKVDGVWKLDLTALSPMLKGMGPMFVSIGAAVDAIIPRVEAGEFATAEDVVAELMGGMGGAGATAPAPRGERPVEDPPIPGNPPKDLVAMINHAHSLLRAKRYEDALRFTNADLGLRQSVLRQYAAQEKIVALDDATKAKFGTSLIDTLGPRASAIGLNSKQLRYDLRANDFNFEMDGEDVAVVTREGSPIEWVYRKSGGSWKVDFMEHADLIQGVERRTVAIGEASERLTRRLNAGGFSSAEEVAQAFLDAVN